jgi:hypothetical protein
VSALLLRAFRTTLVKGGIGRTAVWKGEHRHAQRLHNRGLICYWRDPGLGNAITLTWRGMKVAYRLHRLHRRRP